MKREDTSKVDHEVIITAMTCHGVTCITTDIGGKARTGKTWQGALRALRTLERGGLTFSVHIRSVEV